MLLQGDGVTALEGVYGRKPARLFCPSWATRIVARSRARSLDHALMQGADPAASALLAAHARRLTSPPMRVLLATCLKHLTQPADKRFQVRPAATAVKANARLLNEIAARLREPAPVYSAGMARLHWLLSDGTGPVYADRTGEWLEEELSIVRAALRG